MDTIVLILTPVMVAVATWIVRSLGPKIPGVVIVGVVVPILSAAASALTYFIGASTDVILQAALGLVAVFVAELIKQWKQGATP